MSGNISFRHQARFLTAIERLQHTDDVWCQSRHFTNILTVLQNFARVENSQDVFRDATLISEKDVNALRTLFAHLPTRCLPHNVSKVNQARIDQCKLLLSLVSAGPAGKCDT